MEAEALIQLGKYGIVGIMLALIGLIGYIVYLLSQAYKQHQDVFGQYMSAETQAKLELTKRLTELKDVIKDLK